MSKTASRDDHPIEESDDFDFGMGDELVVRVRENGDSGTIVGKFEATCEGFYDRPGARTMRARVDPPWDNGLSSVLLFAPYEAEFEVVD